MRRLAVCYFAALAVTTSSTALRADWSVDFEGGPDVPEPLQVWGGDSATFEATVQDGALRVHDTRSPQAGGHWVGRAWVDQQYSDVRVSAVLNPDGASRHWGAVVARHDIDNQHQYEALTYFGEGEYKGILWLGKLVVDPENWGGLWEHHVTSGNARLPDITQPCTLELDVTDIFNDLGERTHVEVVARLFDHNNELVSSLSILDDGSWKTSPFDVGTAGYISSVRFGGSTSLYGTLDMISATGTVVPDGSGDYNHNGQLDAGDLDLQAVAISGGEHPPEYDLTGDQLVTYADRQFWVEELEQTWVGDADLNGEFNSGDMVQVFVAGQYETAEAAGWSQGDWNGDVIFDSSDMVAAFADGGYEQGLRMDAVAAPEPGGWLLLSLGVVSLLVMRQRHRAELP